MDRRALEHARGPRAERHLCGHKGPVGDLQLRARQARPDARWRNRSVGSRNRVIRARFTVQPVNGPAKIRPGPAGLRGKVGVTEDPASGRHRAGVWEKPGPKRAKAELGTARGRPSSPVRATPAAHPGPPGPC